MAHERKSDQQKTFNSCVDLNGVLTTAVRAELVIEFVKDLLYQRQQISLPFEQIRQDVLKLEKTTSTEAEASRRPTGIGRLTLETRKKKAIVESITNLSENLTQVFALSSSVRSILVSFGPTIISPKETYLLRFPTSIFDGRVLSLKHCKAALFQQLVTSPFFEEVPAPKSCTKLWVFIELLEPICDDLQLLPRHEFKIPTRGSHFELSFICHTPVVSGDLTRGRDADFDISGVEPFNHSVIDSEHSNILKRLTSHGSQGSDDISMSHSSPGLAGTPASSGSQDHVMDIDHCNTPHHCASPMLICETPSMDTTADLPYVWFQLPGQVQGYKDKNLKTATK